jgi:DNA-binding NtrC family response regulator
MPARILVAEDDTTQREIIDDILSASGYHATVCPSAEESLEELAEHDYDLLLTDLKMPGMDGIELLQEVKRRQPEVDVIIMTAFATVATAVQAMREGATDYLEKPFDKDRLLLVIERALRVGALRRENLQLRALVGESLDRSRLIGESPAMQWVLRVAERAAPIDSTVLILGESGTGKELIARHIHFNGPRKDRPFVVVNCAAIPDTLVESELFGHEKGAFTGAEKARAGKFEAADTGTIFLDEIGDMQQGSQAKLLRVLQDGMVERVGATEGRNVDVRVIAATNQDLGALVEKGAFREDLYYRLEVLPIHLPPLRARMEDLPALVEHFREKLTAKLGRPAPAVPPPVLEAMARYRWPGNIRELENTLEQLFILSDSDKLSLDELPEKIRHRAPQPSGFTLPPEGLVLEDLEQDLIRQALSRSGGRIKEAAELLGLSYKTLQYRLKKHDIERTSPEAGE